MFYDVLQRFTTFLDALRGFAMFYEVLRLSKIMTLAWQDERRRSEEIGAARRSIETNVSLCLIFFSVYGVFVFMATEVQFHKLGARRKL